MVILRTLLHSISVTAAALSDALYQPPYLISSLTLPLIYYCNAPSDDEEAVEGDGHHYNRLHLLILHLCWRLHHYC
jgi:hypothetical protein